MSAPDTVHELTERFGRNLPAYKQGRYNETLLRVEFINPLFKALGWDVDNARGYAEAYKDVVHDSLWIGMVILALTQPTSFLVMTCISWAS